MDLDAQTFAILSVSLGLIVAGIWDWIAHLLNELNCRDWWEDIENEEDEVDESDRHESGKK